ncbi:hypothetical protein JTB14_029106 [Gonioctena quinquepunctata]|nr:hypothetical protein JTB14_029106 [Gonioctena quinquepunctata]
MPLRKQKTSLGKDLSMKTWELTHGARYTELQPKRSSASTSRLQSSSWMMTLKKMIMTIIRLQGVIYKGYAGEHDHDIQFQKDWLEMAIYKINPNRALNFSHELSKGLEDQLTRLYGLCFNLAYFPDAWKQGSLITILKAPDKDPSDPKSLRPIIVLSGLRKVLKLASGNYTVVAKHLSKRCPQGSVLGPMLWNLKLDFLLRLHWPEGVQLTAYADDVVFSIHVPNRRILEDRANSALSTLTDWVGQHKLSISLPTFSENDTPLKTIYQRAILPILAYGVEVWGHRLSHVSVKAKLLNIQAFCLRPILGIYSSTPCETAWVLTGCPPLHLHLQYSLAACRNIKTGGRALLFGNGFSIANFRWVRKVIPLIQSWLNAHNVSFERTSACLLSSHVNLGVHLHKVGKSLNNLCNICEEVDSSSHRLMSCPNFIEQRRAVLAAMNRWPHTSAELIINLGNNVNLLKQFCTEEQLR